MEKILFDCCVRAGLYFFLRVGVEVFFTISRASACNTEKKSRATMSSASSGNTEKKPKGNYY